MNLHLLKRRYKMNKLFGDYDKTIFWLAALFCLLFVGITVANPAAMQTNFQALFNFFITNLGWLYLLLTMLFLVFCLVLAFSKYGHIRLGKDDEKPEFSTQAWFAMLFAAGMGIGLVFWGVAEPIYHFAGPPFADPGTKAAALEAMRYSFFHWGLHPWACYGVVAMCLAYFQFRRGMPGLISSTFVPLLGEKGISGGWGKTIDIFTIVVTLFGVATSLGLGAMQITTGLDLVMGIPASTAVSIGVIVVITVLFTISAVTGISRGIKWLSTINMYLFFLLMVAVLFLGPTRYLINTFVESLGAYLQNIIIMSFYTDAQGAVLEHAGWDWVGGWTVFYWAWWITWAPFVGSFIARISRGRTIKEFVFGILLAPTLLCMIWFGIMGGTAINIELFGAGGIVDATYADVTTAIFAMFSNLPAGGLLSVVAMILTSIFFITSADSSTYVVSMMTSGGNLHPKNTLRVFWGIVAGSIAAMLLLTGGLSAVQTVAFVFGFPFMIIMVFMMYSLLKAFREDENVEVVVQVEQKTG
jgi:glycine betaine transporter